MPQQHPDDLEPVVVPSEQAQLRAKSTFHPSIAVAAALLLGGGVGYGLGRFSTDNDAGRSDGAPAASTLPLLQPTEASHGSLVLGQGDGAAEWTYVVLDPGARPFVVSVKVSPPDADVAFAVRTPTEGRTLNIGRTKDNPTCDRGTGWSTCQFDLGLLHTEHAGTWILRLEKFSAAAATVDVTLNFENR